MKTFLLILLRYWPAIAVLIGMYVFSNGWLAIGLYHFGVIAVALVTGANWRILYKGFKFVPAIGLWLIGACSAVLVFFLLPLLLQMSSNEVGVALRDGLQKYGLEGNQFWLFFVYLCLPHPSIEEIGWRELLFVDTKRIHFRDIEFASYHLLVMHCFFPSAWPFLIGTLISLSVVGWVWRQMRLHYGGLAVPTWFHSGCDVGVMLGVWLLMNSVVEM